MRWIIERTDRLRIYLYHMWLQRVLGRKVLCRCCTFTGEPIYDRPIRYEDIRSGQLYPVCEICDDWDPVRGRTW